MLHWPKKNSSVFEKFYVTLHAFLVDFVLRIWIESNAILFFLMKLLLQPGNAFGEIILQNGCWRGLLTTFVHSWWLSLTIYFPIRTTATVKVGSPTQHWILIWSVYLSIESLWHFQYQETVCQERLPFYQMLWSSSWKNSAKLSRWSICEPNCSSFQSPSWHNFIFSTLNLRQ